MDRRALRSIFCGLSVGLLVLSSAPARGQIADAADIPQNFKLDFETAGRLRSELMSQSIAPAGRYSVGRLVFERLVQQTEAAPNLNPTWQLRIVEDDQLNAYASPDGTVYVESGLARLAGTSTGLWAAILSHEIAHVSRRDWARRYLYQESLERGGGAAIVLGDPGIPSVSWTDSQKASENMAHFCRQLEVDADRDGLMLMARAGYHPDFVPALHHLLHAVNAGGAPRSLYAMHPCWEERDQQLSRAYVDASIEFAHRWPAWYASPGGNPPVVVFTEQPRFRKATAGAWQIQIPMRCQNLAGAVEVVLTSDNSRITDQHPSRLDDAPESNNELRQLTGCTSPKTTITFTLGDEGRPGRSTRRWTDVYVLDAWGTVLARADIPNSPH
jgi:hypothetical protein